MKYFYSHDGTNQQGPVTLEQLRQVPMSATTIVWYDGLPEWTPAHKLPELVDLSGQNGPAAASSSPLPPQPPPSSPGPISYASPVAHKSVNPLAMTSMILGIVGLVLLPCLSILAILPSALAVVFGHLGRSQVRKGNGTGGGFALTGLILGYVTFVLMIVLVGLYLAVQAYTSNANATTRGNGVPPVPQPIPRLPAVPAKPPSRPMPTFPEIPRPGNGGQGN